MRMLVFDINRRCAVPLIEDAVFDLKVMMERVITRACEMYIMTLLIILFESPRPLRGIIVALAGVTGTGYHW